MNNELNISLEEQRKIQLEGLLYIKNYVMLIILNIF